MHRRTNAGGCRIALHLTAVLLVLSLAGRRAHAEATEPGANDDGTERTRTEPLPIVMYDTDVGVGYGAKLFLLNHLHHAESLDMVVFNSTKGQRWVRLLFSSPDFEDRQGEEYPLSLDLFADYDARIKASFFGVGPAARQDDRETYRREALDMSVTLGRGFSPSVVGQAALRYRSVRHGDFGAGSHLRLLPPRQNAASASWASLVLSLRRDTRDSFVNPTRGLVLQTDGEFAPSLGANGPRFARFGAWVRGYVPFANSRVVLAMRAGLEGLTGDDLPVQAMLALGGAGTLRGFSQDRYLGRARALANIEARFPLFRRLGGVVAWDAGRVWSSVADASFRDWSMSPAVGLRYHLETFVVRLDVGMGSETTGVYFNFGQLY